jgi:hypothetical protein
MSDARARGGVGRRAAWPLIVLLAGMGHQPGYAATLEPGKPPLLALLPLAAAGSGLLLAQSGANPIQAVGVPILLGASSWVPERDWGRLALHPLGTLAAGYLGGLVGFQVWPALTTGRTANLGTDIGADSLETGVLLGVAAGELWEAWERYRDSQP